MSKKKRFKLIGRKKKVEKLTIKQKYEIISEKIKTSFPPLFETDANQLSNEMFLEVGALTTKEAISKKLDEGINIIKANIIKDPANETPKPLTQPSPPQAVKPEEAARLWSDKYNAATKGKHMANEVRHSFYNHQNIIAAMGYKYNKDASELIKYTDKPRAICMDDAPRVKEKDEPIMILASGITLDDALPLLKNWKHKIMVSTSHASTCIYWGKEPDYILALDPDSNRNELNADTWKDRKSILITHPGVTPGLFEFWKGPIYLFRKLQPQTPFFDNSQKIGYSTLGMPMDKTNMTPAEFAKKYGAKLESGSFYGQGSQILIKAQVPMLACVLAAQICIAKQLGYQRLYLVGADLAYTRNMERFTSWTYHKGQWVESPGRKVGNKPLASEPLIELEDGVRTNRMFIFYANQVITAWRITETDIVSASNEGAIKIFPTAPIKEIIRKQGMSIKGFNRKKIIEVSEEHSAKQNVYYLVVGNGILPHEFKDPLHEIPIALQRIQTSIAQQKTNIKIDVDANMKRIRKLWNKVSTIKKPKIPFSDKVNKIFKDATEPIEKSKEMTNDEKHQLILKKIDTLQNTIKELREKEAKHQK